MEIEPILDTLIQRVIELLDTPEVGVIFCKVHTKSEWEVFDIFISSQKIKKKITPLFTNSYLFKNNGRYVYAPPGEIGAFIDKVLLYLLFLKRLYKDGKRVNINRTNFVIQIERDEK